MAHVLIPTDLTETSIRTVRSAVDLFGTTGNTFTLLHTYPPPGMADPMVTIPILDLQRLSEDALAEFERNLRTQHDLSGAHIVRRVEMRPLPLAVDALAKEQDIDLVIMSSRGGRRSSFLGSNTTDVIMGAHVPVLELPEGIEPHLKRILFADDGARIEPHVLDPLVSIARMVKAEVIIAHIATGRPAHDLIDNSARFKEAFAGVHYRTVMVEDNSAEQGLLRLAQSEHVDLIAMLHRHRGIWDGLFHSSLAKAMVLHGQVPILALEQ